jgi:hypothetical protein
VLGVVLCVRCGGCGAGRGRVAPGTEEREGERGKGGGWRDGGNGGGGALNTRWRSRPHALPNNPKKEYYKPNDRRELHRWSLIEPLLRPQRARAHQPHHRRLTFARAPTHQHARRQDGLRAPAAAGGILHGRLPRAHHARRPAARVPVRGRGQGESLPPRLEREAARQHSHPRLPPPSFLVLTTIPTIRRKSP